MPSTSIRGATFTPWACCFTNCYPRARADRESPRGGRGSASREAGLEDRATLSPVTDEPIRILRVIARLNVGGPALHVSYLTRELDKIGYETTLVAGLDRRERGLDGVGRRGARGRAGLPAGAAAGDLAAPGSRRRAPAPHADPGAPAGHPAHAHGEGRRGRAARGAARRARRGRRVVVHTFHGHVLRGYFGPAKTAAFRQARAATRAAQRRADRRLARRFATISSRSASRRRRRSP